MAETTKLEDYGNNLSIEEFVPFIGYACVYTDPDESYAGVLKNVQFFTNVSTAQLRGHEPDPSAMFYIVFDGASPVTILKNQWITLEMFR